ncbi:pilin [Acinetobacter pittii]|uniref:Pilin n=1 Tax=Acinetobacter haemolyticus TaxID=29430 RepID=A0AAW4J226_ACIHA|nr:MULTISPECIES: pilin [Acinetobacter]MBN6532934.1 pilin [Acinetobacter pittii]MBO3657007.1 pilin [Acinetobacter haemolyticus]
MQKGFTLIELMIVTAIISILAAIAVPAYQTYSVRAQAAEGITLSNAIKTSIEEFYADRGTWPTDNTNLSISQPIVGSYVSNIQVANGIITITYGNKASLSKLATKKLTIRPALSLTGDVSWVCGYSVTPIGLTSIGINQTTVEPLFLPNSCRI